MQPDNYVSVIDLKKRTTKGSVSVRVAQFCSRPAHGQRRTGVTAKLPHFAAPAARLFEHRAVLPCGCNRGKLTLSRHHVDHGTIRPIPACNPFMFQLARRIVPCQLRDRAAILFVAICSSIILKESETTIRSRIYLD